MLISTTPRGDDTTVHVQKIIDLSRNFLNFHWDPRQFNGYDPSIGFAWASYAPPALFVSLGLDPLVVFHWTFLAYFLAMGPCVYYTLRSLSARRVVALAGSVLAMSTPGWWGYVGGGAESRVFTLPYMFLALGLTIRYARAQNLGLGSARTYLLLLALWTLTVLGDVYVAAVPVIVAVIFVLLSAGTNHFRAGLRRVATLFVPVLAFTAWFWIPLGLHLLSVSSPASDLTVSTTSQLFWTGPAATIVALYLRKTYSKEKVPVEYLAILVSLSIVFVYFLIMGAIVPLWAYIPRLWSTYDSFNLLSFLFPLTIGAVFFYLKPLRKGRLVRNLAILLVILVMVNAIPTIDLSQPPDRTIIDNAYAQVFAANFARPINSRVSLQSRTLTRWFPFYDQSTDETGGRVLGLDPSPYYQNWYETEAFFKDDLSTLSSIYIEDQPNINLQAMVGSPENYASTLFWLDWYGVSTLVLNTGFYPVQNTANNYTQRGALFSTQTLPTQYGSLFFVQPHTNSPILMATNASAIGFYSQQSDSKALYNNLLALLSYVGLGPSYIVPVYLSSLNGVVSGEFSAIITDDTTYAQEKSTLAAIQGPGTRIIVVSTNFLTQSQGPAGSANLVQLIAPLLQTEMQTLTNGPSPPPYQTITVSPAAWSVGPSQNAVSSLQSNSNNLTMTVNIPDSTKPATVDIGAHFLNPLVLWRTVETDFQITPSTPTNATIFFSNGNFTGTYLSAHANLKTGQNNSLQFPFDNFTWNNLQSEFALATGLNETFTIPAGTSTARYTLSTVSVSQPQQTFYQLSTPLSITADGYFQQHDASTGCILTNETGALIGEERSINNDPSTVIPLASFTSSSNRTFDRIITNTLSTARGSSTLTVFFSPNALPIGNSWITNERLTTQAIPAGFSGLVWKETFTNNWNLEGVDQAGNGLSLPYYLAGPGMIYSPLEGRGLKVVNPSYSDTIITIVLPVLSGLSTIPVIVFRRRISQAGLSGRLI